MKTTKQRPRSPAKRSASRTGDRVIKLFDAGMKLPERERRSLVELLAHSLPEPGVRQAEVDASWDAEIQRRLDEIDSGKVKMIPAEEVFRKMRARLSRRARR